MYKFKTKLSKSKIVLTTLACLSFGSFSLFALSSCGSISQSLLDKRISKGDGTKIADGYDLNRYSTSAIKNSNGSRLYLDNVSNRLALSWIESIASRPGNNDYKTALENEKKFIDKSYNDTFDSYKKNNGSDFPLIFQQEILDPSGGTEESWKQDKLLTWARTEFQTKAFSKDYLTTINTTTKDKVPSPSKTDLIGAISGTPNSFAFTEKANESLSEIDTYLDPIYANFHKFIFDKWVEIENPFVINMALWKYSTPKNGLNSVYLSAPAPAPTPPPSESSLSMEEIKTREGEGDATPVSGSYIFPYFSNDNATNDASGTVDKFVKFVTNAQTNYISDNTNGLIDIPKEYTEDSSTYILAKNGSIYNDLYIEFAAAATYLLYSGKALNGTTSVADINTNLQKAINTTSTTTDIITSNFVSNSSLNNLDIKLGNSLASQIINKDGEFKGLLGANNTSDLFITDAFKASDAKLNNFMFLRNEAGVHAIAIDGKTFIDKATTIDGYKKNAANIVLYRSLLNKNGYSDFGIDVKSELNTFLSNNFTSLLYQFASDTTIPTNLQMFDPTTDFGAETHTFNQTLNKYLFDESKYSRKKDYQAKMHNAKVKFSSNYGVLAKDNGFAAPWVYSYQSADTTNFDLINSLYSPDPFATSGTYSTFVNAISAFITSLNLAPLTSSFDGFQYSQYIYTNNKYINYALIAFGNDGNSMSDEIKSNILLDYLKADFDNSLLEVNASIFANATFNNQVKENINNAINNFFFDSTFTSLENKWYNLNEAKSTGTITYANLNTYRKSLWQKALEVNNSSKSSAYYNLHLLVSTIKYLLSDNATEFMNYLQSKISIGIDSYITWYESSNSFLEPTAKNVGTLFNISQANLLKNVNNSYSSSYFGSAPSDTASITNNTVTTPTTFYSSMSSYYKYVGESVGFVGLQTAPNNSAPTVIQERLFTKQNLNKDQVGSLYSYGTKDNLINIINNFSLVQDIDNLVNSFKTKLGTISFDSVINATTLATKKVALIEILNSASNTSTINSFFQPRTGYISNGTLTEDSGALIEDATSNNLKFGAKVIHINYDDVSTLDKFKTALMKNNYFTNEKANDIFFNLVVQAATDINIQNNMLNNLLSYNVDSITNRINVYDVRLSNQLGVKWIKNWK
ncbi:MAG: hypothetical protein RR697_02410 [Malacoplasma sp.]